MSWRDPSTSLQPPEHHCPQHFLTAAHSLNTDRVKPALGMVSARARLKMVERLKASGINNSTVLMAMQAVERHLFVDTALASRAYENLALPIGFKQTISQPSIVASMLSLACDAVVTNAVWLEIGTGCGYQAAVMAHCNRQICSIERVNGLYISAKKNLSHIPALLDKPLIQLCFGDGSMSWHSQNNGYLSNITQFDAIVVAAAAKTVLPVWLKQLNIGGRLIVPIEQSHNVQHLSMIERVSELNFTQHILQPVQFVPLLSGTSVK